MSKQPPICLANYILDAAPAPGDEFVVRVLDGELNPSKSNPWLRVYIRRADRDSETADFYVTYEGEEPWTDE